MDWLLLLISVAVTLTYNLIRNTFSKQHAKSGMDFQLFNLVCSIVSMLTVLLTAGITGAAAPSLYTLLFGVVFGVITALNVLFGMQALERGPASYTTLLITASMMIPALSGWVLFDEPFSWIKLAGMGLVLISVLLSVTRDSGERRASLRWLAVCLLAMLFTGLIGVLQKVHQSSSHSGERMYFLVVAFAVSTVYSGAALLIGKARSGHCRISLSPRGAVCWMALVSGRSSIVFFPTVNGANLLLMLLALVVFFHERLDRLQWLGIAVGSAGIALLCFG